MCSIKKGEIVHEYVNEARMLLGQIDAGETTLYIGIVLKYKEVGDRCPSYF